MSVDNAAEAAFDGHGRPLPKVLLGGNDDRPGSVDQDAAPCEQSFEYERLRMFAARELSAWPAMPLLALVVCLALVNWAPLEQLGLWLAAVLMAKGIVLALCRQMQNGPADAAAWRGKLWAGEFLYGMTWAGLAFVDITSNHQAAYFLIFAAFLIVIANRMIFASTVMPLLYPGTVPLTAALVLRSALTGDMFYFSLAIAATAIHIYFMLLARGLNATLVDMLAYRAQKEALIAELEQSRAVSDEARRRAENASMAKSRFLATMSHELRTPLNAIIGFTDFIRSETLGPIHPSQYADYINDVNESGKHLLNVINAILDMSKVEANRIELREDYVDPSELAASAARMMRETASRRGVAIRLESENAPPELYADGQLVRQILLNLLSNALKFSGDADEIRLEVGCSEEGGCVLSVVDYGVGIADDDLERVLEPFTQADSSHSRTAEGTGLGLPLCSALAKAHGGRLEIASEVGKGTRVDIHFPPGRTIRNPSKTSLQDAG